MPPTPRQSSHLSIEDMGSSWNARERTVIARIEQYLSASDFMKLEILELELLLGPGDSEVFSRCVLRNASGEGGMIF